MRTDTSPHLTRRHQRTLLGLLTVCLGLALGSGLITGVV